MPSEVKFGGFGETKGSPGTQVNKVHDSDPYLGDKRSATFRCTIFGEYRGRWARPDLLRDKGTAADDQAEETKLRDLHCRKICCAAKLLGTAKLASSQSDCVCFVVGVTLLSCVSTKIPYDHVLV